jgi:Co/Zn/Cd efflux system component
VSIKPTRVVDWRGLLYKFLCLLALFGASVLAVVQALSRGESWSVVAPFIGIAAVVGLICAYLAAGALKCHEIDPAKDQIRHPRFVFFRGRIVLSKVRRVDTVVRVAHGYGFFSSRETGRTGPLEYGVVLSGDFGSRTIWFWSEAVRAAFLHALDIAQETRRP